MNVFEPYSEYKDSGVEWVGKVPSEWGVKRLSWLFRTISSGTTPPDGGTQYYDGDINWVTTGELRESVITETSKKVTPMAVSDLSALRVYEPGTLLIAMYGATIGRLGILGNSATTNQACCGMSDPHGVLTKFVYYALLAAREHLLVIASGGGQPNINQDKLRSLRICTPSLEEQQSIVSFLDRENDEIDGFIADQEELIGLLSERRAATVTQAVTKGLEPDVATKESTLGWQSSVNAAWSVVQLKVAGNVTLGKMLQSEQKMATDELRTYMRAANVQPNHLELSDQQQMWFSKREASSLDLRAGDVVVVEGGAGFGRSAYLTEDLVGWAFQNSINRIRPGASSDGRYLNYVLKAIYASGYLDIVCNKATIPHLTAEKLEALRVPLPTKNEQAGIADYLDFETAEIDAAIADAKEAIELSKERRAALISAVVTGKIDVRNHITAELGAA